MNNSSTPNRQRIRQLSAACFFTQFYRRHNDEEQPYDGNDPPIWSYGIHNQRIWKSRHCQHHEDRLLHLIRHEAEKMDSSKNGNNPETNMNEK